MKKIWRSFVNTNPIIQFLILSFIIILLFFTFCTLPDFIINSILIHCLPEYIYINRERLISETDQSNIIQLFLLVGALIAIIEALKTRKETVRQREAEYQPILTIFIRDSEHKGTEGDKHWKYNFKEEGENGKYIVIRNNGKGTALNLRVEYIYEKEKREVYTYQQQILEGNGDEQAVKLTQNISDINLETDQSIEFILSAQSATKKTYIYSYSVNFKTETVRYLGIEVK